MPVTPFVIILWAAAHEAPLCALMSHPSSSTTLDSITSSLNVVSLFRFVTSLELLSADPCEAAGATTTTTDTHVSILSCSVPRRPPQQALPCAFASTTFCRVAALTVAETCGAESPWLPWVAASVCAYVNPAAWQTTTAAVPLNKAAGTRCSSLGRLPPPREHADLSDQLTQFWAAATASAQAEAVEVERYGVREVLADGSNNSHSLATLLADTQARAAENEKSPVDVAVNCFLKQWWTPFAVPAPKNALRFQLAGFFGVAATSTLPGPPQGRGPLISKMGMCSSYVCLPACNDALRLLADFCHHHQVFNSTDSPDSVPMIIIRLSSNVALVAAAVDVPCGGTSSRMVQVALVLEDSKSTSTTELSQPINAPTIHNVSRQRLSSVESLWCSEVLGDLL